MHKHRYEKLPVSVSVLSIIQYNNYMGNNIIKYNKSHTRVIWAPVTQKGGFNAVVYYHVSFVLSLPFVLFPHQISLRKKPLLSSKVHP